MEDVLSVNNVRNRNNVSNTEWLRSASAMKPLYVRNRTAASVICINNVTNGINISNVINEGCTEIVSDHKLMLHSRCSTDVTATLLRLDPFSNRSTKTICSGGLSEKTRVRLLIHL